MSRYWYGMGPRLMLEMGMKDPVGIWIMELHEVRYGDVG